MTSPVRLAKVEPWNAGAPSIHGPDITGASAGKPFFYAIPVTGERPLSFAAEGLPAGLHLDASTGFITGAATRDGDTRGLLRAANRHGKGLKFGIYSSPWVEPWGCGAEEAKADWGGDALIGCSAGDHDAEFPRHHMFSGKFVGKETASDQRSASWWQACEHSRGSDVISAVPQSTPDRDDNPGRR